MKTRESLNDELKKILGNGNVYFQPPESIKLKYPCIIYSLKDMNITNANNRKYLRNRKYELMLIDKDPDSVYVDKILNFQYCRLGNIYVTDSLNHFIFELFY